MFKIFKSRKSKKQEEQEKVETEAAKKQQMIADEAYEKLRQMMDRDIKTRDSSQFNTTTNTSSYADKSHEEVRQVERAIKDHDAQLKEILNGEVARKVNSFGLDYLDRLTADDSKNQQSIAYEKSRQMEQTMKERDERIASIYAGEDVKKINNYGLSYLNQLMVEDDKQKAEHEAAVRTGEAMLRRKQEQEEAIKKAREESAREMDEYTRNLYLPMFNRYMEKINEDLSSYQQMLGQVDNYDEDELFKKKAVIKIKLDSYNKALGDDFLKEVPEFAAQYKNKINECIKCLEEIDKKVADKLYAIIMDFLHNNLNHFDNFFNIIKQQNGISYEGAIKNMSHVDRDIENHKNKIDKFMQVLSPEQASEVNRLGNEIINRFLLMKKYSIESINAHNQQQGIGDEGEQQQGGRKL